MSREEFVVVRVNYSSLTHANRACSSYLKCGYHKVVPHPSVCPDENQHYKYGESWHVPTLCGIHGVLTDSFIKTNDLPIECFICLDLANEPSQHNAILIS